MGDMNLMGMWEEMGWVAKAVAIILVFMSMWSFGVAIERYYTYPDACTSLRLNLTGRYADLRAGELTSVFGFVGRGNLDERIGDVSDHRLHLDPSNQR